MSRIRRKSSRQLSPQSTRIRVRPPVTTVALPLDPDASTVNRTMLRGYRVRLLIAQKRGRLLITAGIFAQLPIFYLTLKAGHGIIIPTKFLLSVMMSALYASQGTGFSQYEVSRISDL
jgi:hypothetical protein